MAGTWFAVLPLTASGRVLCSPGGAQREEYGGVPPQDRLQVEGGHER